MLIEKCNGGISSGYCRQYIYIDIDQKLEVGRLYKVIIDQVSLEGVKGHAA